MRIEIIITLVFTLITHTVFSWRSYKVHITDVHGECVNDLCNATLTINKTTLAIGFDFKTDNEFDPFIFNFALSKINANKTETVILNKSVDICAFLRNKQSFQLISTIYNDLKNYGDIIKKCPATGHYYANDFIVDSEKFPAYMPAMKLRVNGTITAGFSNEKGKLFTIVKFNILLFVDNSMGVNRLIKINGK